MLTKLVRAKGKKMPRRIDMCLKHNVCSEDGSILSLKREIQLLFMAPERVKNIAARMAPAYY
jgi:hypothetical protein